MGTVTITAPGGARFYYPGYLCETIGDGAEAIQAPIMHFAALTGPLPKQKPKRQEIIDLLAPAFRNGFYGYLSPYLEGLNQWAQYENLVAAYQNGKISPELLAILEEEPEPMPQEYAGMDKGAKIFKMIQEKKLDFEPFRGERDTETNWFFFYRVAFSPLPMRRSLEGIAAIASKERAATLQHLKTQVSLMFGENNGQSPDRAAETLLLKQFDQYAAAVEKQYTARVKGKTPRDYGSPFQLPAATGFYVNPVTYKITDLRPFQPELKKLLSVISWDFLRDYAAAIREAVQEERDRRQAAQTDLFQGAEFIPLKTTPETMAISSVTSGLSPLYFQPSIPGLDGTTEHTAELLVNKKDGALRLKVKDLPDGRGLRPRAQKVKVLLEAVYTQKRKNIFAFSIRDYMRLCKPGKPEEYYYGVRYRKFSAKLREDMKTLVNTTFSVNYPGLPSGEIHILDGFVPGPNGSMEVSLGGIYCRELLAKGGVSQICRTFWQSNEINPHVVPFLLKLCGNRTNPNNIIKGGQRANTISFKSLFDYDRINFPPLEKVKKSRKYRELLIEPILKTIAQLNDEGHITSRYVNANHEEHTTDDLSRVTFSDFMDSKKWLLEYEINGFEEDPQMIVKAEERKKKRRPYKKKAAKKTE
jgi:hypothetical protein